MPSATASVSGSLSAYLPGLMGSLRAMVFGSLLSRWHVSVVPLRPGPVITMFLSADHGASPPDPRKCLSLSTTRLTDPTPPPRVLVRCLQDRATTMITRTARGAPRDGW